MATNPPSVGSTGRVVNVGRGRAQAARVKAPSDPMAPGLREENEVPTLRKPKVNVGKDVYEDIHWADNHDFDDLLDDVKRIKPGNIADLATVESKLSQRLMEEQDLKTFIACLFKRSLENVWFATNAAQLGGRLSHFVVQDHKFRNELLQHLQREFRERERIRQVSKSRYLGGVNFLGQCVHYLRLADTTPIKALVQALATSLQELIKGRMDAEEIDLLCKQLRLNGPDLSALCADDLEEILVHVRQFIVEHTLPYLSTYKLLAALEMAAAQGRPLHPKAREFYEDQEVL